MSWSPDIASPQESFPEEEHRNNVPELVWGILVCDPILEDDFSQRYIFVSDDPSSVDIALSIENSWSQLESFQRELCQYIDKIYENGYYFSWLDIFSLEKLLYWTGEEVDAILSPRVGKIQIANRIEKLPLQDNALSVMYEWNITLSQNNIQAEYLPKNPFSHIEKMFWEDNKENKDYILMNKDYFHAFFWRKSKIKYYGTSSFLDVIDGKHRSFLDTIPSAKSSKNLSWTLAVSRLPTETIHDIFIEKVPLEIKRAPLVIDGKIDYTRFTCAFPQAKKWECIFEIKQGILGKTWVSIDGSRIEPEKIKIIEVKTLIEDMSDITIEDNSWDGKWIRVLAKEDVYILMKNNKYSFSKKMKHIGDIGPGRNSLWSFHLPDNTEFILQGTIQKGFYISVYSLVYSGYLYGKIEAKRNTHVERWSVLWGEIMSANGNITVDAGARIQNNSTLTALDWIITIAWDVSNSIIMGDEIYISGTATNCQIIGRKVSVVANRWSRVLAESIVIKEDLNPKLSEYTILIYSGIERIIALAKQKKEAIDQAWEKIKVQKSTLKKLFLSLEKTDPKRWIIAKEATLFEQKEGEYKIELSKINDVFSLCSRDEVLFSWPSDTISIMPNALIMSDTLYAILHAEETNESTLIRTNQKKDWYNSLLNRNLVYQQIPYTWEEFTRGDILKKAELNLSSRLSRIDSMRNIIYPRVHFPVTCDEIAWNLYDYSDQWSAFVFKKTDIKTDFTLVINNTIWISLLNNQFPFFVTRVESDVRIWNEYYYKIAWFFLNPGMWKDIAKEVWSYEPKKQS